jgi:N4-gp56 family major capsid protein
MSNGQVWAVPEEGGYLYSDELSDTLRSEVQPLTKFRQLADAKDGTKKGLNRGDAFSWDVYSKVGRQGRRLAENQTMPETGFTVAKKSLTVYEAGNSVPFTAKLDALSKHPVTEIIDKALKDDCRKYFDIEAFLQFKNTKLRAGPESGTSTTAITLDTAGTCTTTNNVAMGTGHVKAIVDTMKERNIPPFIADDYVCVTHPSTLRPFKNSLETLHQYTEQGLQMIFSGEVGRYEGTRFIEQNHIAKGGAADSVTYDPWESTADAWNNAKSSWAFFCGGDTATEAIVIPEEIRAKLAGDYGRSKGIAWYYLGGFGIVHDDATNSRIVMWDSAA